MMGWLSSAGAMARMICPVAAGYAYNYAGPNYIFLAAAILTCLANLLFVVFFPHIKARLQAAQPPSGSINA